MLSIAHDSVEMLASTLENYSMKSTTCDQQASVHGISIHSSPNTGNCSSAASIHANPATIVLAGSHNDPGFNTANCGASASSKAGFGADGDNGQHGNGSCSASAHSP